MTNSATTPSTPKPRLIIWFSCGAASAVAAKISIKHYSHTYNVEVVNCDTRSSEHKDNYRFSQAIEKWIEQPITYIRSLEYTNVDDVIVKTRYMSGVRGARCTTELKKLPRHAYCTPDDYHVFGFTAEEQKRVREFESRNPDLRLMWPLVDLSITKDDCYKLLSHAGIELPVMYRLGFNNNNCPGCVKATSPWYWDKIRTHFPEVFARRCKQSRELGVRLVQIKHHERIFLDELPLGPFKAPRKKENLSCGPECGLPTL